MIIYSLRPVSMLSDFAQQKTNTKSEMTHCVISLCGSVFHWDFRWVLNSDWDQRSAKKWSRFSRLTSSNEKHKHTFHDCEITSASEAQRHECDRKLKAWREARIDPRHNWDAPTNRQRHSSSEMISTQYCQIYRPPAPARPGPATSELHYTTVE